MIRAICSGVLVTWEMTWVTLTGKRYVVRPSERLYVQVWLSLVRPRGCSHVKVSGVDELDGFGGGCVITKEVAVGGGCEAVDAFGLGVAIGPARGGLVEI
jgi:hypothetical protein